MDHPREKGIYFADDPAFKGKKRELTAHDYVYSMKRLVDPKMRSPNAFSFAGKLAGSTTRLAARGDRQARLRQEIEGLRAIDRYTLRIKLVEPDYTFLARCRNADGGGRARSGRGVRRCERLGHGQSGGHRRLQARRNGGAGSASCSKPIPATARSIFPARPRTPTARAAVAAMKGKRLPQIGRIEISVIEESNPRLLAFNSNELDRANVPRDLVRSVLDDEQPAAAAPTRSRA